MPHPLLQTDNLECIHRGKVLLQSNNKDFLKIKDVGVITLQDLQNASILGCANTIAGVPTPCTKLVSIPESIASTLLKVNGQKVVLAEFINQALTDKGSVITLQGDPKAKGFLEIDQ